MRIFPHFSRYSVVYNDFRLTLHTFHKALLCDLFENGQQFLKYFQLRMAWDSFIKLLPSDEYFCCSICSASLDSIICNRITFGFRTKYHIPILSQESVTTQSLCMDAGEISDLCQTDLLFWQYLSIRRDSQEWTVLCKCCANFVTMSLIIFLLLWETLVTIFSAVKTCYFNGQYQKKHNRTMVVSWYALNSLSFSMSGSDVDTDCSR